MSHRSFAVPSLFSKSIPTVAVPQNDRRLKWIQVGIAVIVLPQLSSILWWMQTRSNVHFRGWINVEYLILLALAFLFPSWQMVGLLTAELTVSLVEPVAHLYYFSPEDALHSLRYLAYIPSHRLALYIGLLLTYTIGCASLLRLVVSRPTLRSTRIARLLLLCAVFPVAYDLTFGHFGVLQSNSNDSDLRSHRVSRAPILSLLAASLLNRPRKSSKPIVPLSSALASAVAQFPGNVQPNIVLVLTESWGLANDDRVNQAELAFYKTEKISDFYQFETGSVEFSGSTTDGETRELCGDSRGRYRLADSPKDFGTCWPARFSREGYRTIAVHGFAPTMFERKAWYRSFGFAQSSFLPELQRDGATMCDGAFPGACDADVAAWIGSRLLDAPGSQPLFIHWVTLNSHLPVAAVEARDSRQDCVAVGLDPEASLCAWFHRILDVQRSVARLATDPGPRPTIFVIVGDHAPPFFQPAVRNRFSQTRVPWVILMPKSIGVDRTPLLRAARQDRPALQAFP